MLSWIKGATGVGLNSEFLTVQPKQSLVLTFHKPHKSGYLGVKVFCSRWMHSGNKEESNWLIGPRLVLHCSNSTLEIHYHLACCLFPERKGIPVYLLAAHSLERTICCYCWEDRSVASIVLQETELSSCRSEILQCPDSSSFAPLSPLHRGVGCSQSQEKEDVKCSCQMGRWKIKGKAMGAQIQPLKLPAL